MNPIMRYRLKCLTISGFGKAVEKQENLDSAGGTVKAATTLESDLAGSSEIENTFPSTQQFHSCMYFQRKSHKCSRAH